VRDLFRSWCVLLVIAGGLGVGRPAFAQGLTGQIGGTILDAQRGALPGATVTVQNVGTRVSRETVTDGQGAFVVTNLLAGTYDLRVTLSGFKTYEQKNIAVSATERVALPPVTLDVGGITESVSVQAEAARVQTQSGERSATITADQIADTGLRGRDFMGTLKVLPGVVDTSNRDAPGWGSVGNMTINGQSSFNFSYDGIVSKDTGSNSGNFAAPALDSIAEVKVQASNFQAEYGRSSGASITVVTKSGSANFHGSAAFFKRDESFNSNSWERKRDCNAGQLSSCSTPPYRYNNTAWTVGGPVLVPGTSFNHNRDKLFFFFSQDLLPRTDPGNLELSTMPTTLERMGDFSQTVDTNGRLRYIRDPQSGLPCNVNTGGPGCFPGNIIPADRINPVGASILSLFPLPNTSDPDRRYNYTFQNVKEKPKNDQVIRMDWNVHPNTTFYSRLGFSKEVNDRSYAGFLGAGTGNGGNQGFPQFYTEYAIKTLSSVSTLLHTFNSTTVLEITGGVNWSQQLTSWVNQATLDANDRTKVLPGLTQFFPSANPLNLIPQMSFGGSNAQPNTRQFGVSNRFPFNAKDITQNYSANLTKVAGAHNLKMGVFIEHTARPAPRASNFNGQFDFGSNVNNPFDTNFGFANALLGTVNSYTESTAQPFAQGRYNQVEFFAQDNWRISHTFTLDYGFRQYYLGPTYVAGQQVAYFDPSRFDPAAAVMLYQPVCPGGAATCRSTTREALNPLTGEVLNNTFIGKLVPGSGDFTNGMAVVHGTPWQGVYRPAPRVGFAWDVTGDGRTAVRGGFGVFFDRYSDDYVLALTEAPPLLETRSTNFTTLPTLLATPLDASTNPNVTAFTETFRPPTVYNWSLGVQRELPFSLVADVAYVGNTNRHNPTTLQLNNLTYGTTRPDLHPENADPTNNGSAKSTDFLRQYVGYTGISDRRWDGYANYHSIQISVSRRFMNRFAASVAYTGSTRHSLGTFNPFLADVGIDNTARNYSANGSRPHNLVINYNYEVPDASAIWDNMFVRLALDGWQVSGVSVFQSGTRDDLSYSFTGAPQNDMTGGGGDSRVVLTCDPNLPRGERTMDRQFRTECVAPPGPLTNPADIYYLGSASTDFYQTNGYMNHDITLFKNFRFSGGRNLQIRMEMYNAFNLNQFTGVDTSATFNFATGEQTDANFGKVTGTRSGSARVIQLGARFTF
jgi:hypothetical protein